MPILWQDLRYGARILAKKPGFTIVAVITLALGIGANTAIFSVVNAVLLRPLPYPEPERLVTFRSNQSTPDLEDLQAQSQSFSNISGVTLMPLDYTGGAEPVQVLAGLAPALYWPYAQSSQPWKRWMDVVVRTGADPSGFVEVIKKQIWRVDPQIPVTKLRTMTEVMAASVAAQRFNLLLLSVFAAVALMLAAAGIYGMMSYSVRQRTHEIGIRMALGAQPRAVLKLVVRQGMISLGVAIGLGTSWALTRLMSNLLYGVGATDPATFAAIAALLTGVALLACYLPARRATKVDPMVALRCE